MALTVWPKPQGTTPLSDFVAYVKSHVDYHDEDSIMRAADRLSALGANEMLLVDAINDSVLNHVEALGEKLALSSQALLLYGDPFFKVRAVVWRPPVMRAGSLDHDDKIYSYRHAHNHNFQLLTLGYFGKGYSTMLYECDPSRIEGYIGEKVELTHLETTRLEKGKVMLYRTLRDVHIQLPAEEFSISLNLIVSDPSGRVAEQYSFDMQEHTLTSVVTLPMAIHMSLLSFITLLGAKQSLPAVLSLARSPVHWRTRTTAFECATVLEPAQALEFWKLAEQDADPQVRRVARHYLATLA